MKWFQLDSDAPDDPKLKAIIRQGIAPNKHQAAAGAIFLLWCYVANHGGSREPGLGVKDNGDPLSELEMMSECFFESRNALTAFLTDAASLGHIHEGCWTQKRVVFLTAMWKRTATYQKQKDYYTGGYDTPEQVAAAVIDGTLKSKSVPAAGKSLTSPGQPLPNRTRHNTTRQRSQKTVADERRPVPSDHDLLGAGAGEDQAQAVVRIWNEERKPGPHVQQLTDNRRRGILRLLKDHPDLDEWRRVIRYINSQKWCNAPGTGDHPNWRADLDHILKAGKFNAALERMAMKTPASAGQGGEVGRDAARGRTGAKRGEFMQAVRGEPTP